MENCIGTVPIHLKMTLTTKEAAEYSNIGINKIDSMLRSPNCPFVLFVGTKKLVKRKEFEQFISEKLVILLMPMLLYSAASLVVSVIFRWIGRCV